MEKNQKTPLISVVIPLFNKEKVVWKTLESVRKQTFTNYEVIIVNDGSTDRSLEVLLDYKQKNPDFFEQTKFRLFNQSNAGVSLARNMGIQEARGEYIAFLDADDEWLPGYLASINMLVQKYPECDVFATSYFYKEPDRFYEARIEKFSFDTSIGIVDNYFEMAVSGNPPLCSSAITISKKSICAIGGFPSLKMGEDLLTWAQLACRYKIAYCKKALAIYNRLPENYQTGSYSNDALPSPANDKGGKMLSMLYSEHSSIKGLKKYCFLWHKMRFVMFVSAGRKWDALLEWRRTFPYGLINLDCYYRLFLNFLPIKWQSKIKKWVGKY